jgi:two-component system sensor histidine kinase RegB
LPLVPVLCAVAASAGLNAWLVLPRGYNRRLDERHAAQHLAFDVVQLALLLGLTGGLSNPFSLFLLAPVTVAAATLSARLVALLACLAVVALSAVGHWHAPLPWIAEDFDIPPLYYFGVWLALVLGVVSVSFFTWRMAEESRRIAAAFSQSRLALEREQRVAEVGALAAAVAHELNTPLATVCLIARDLASELRETAWRDDIDMLIGQAERCRVTLTHLTQRSAQGEAVESERIAFPALVELAAAQHRRDGVLVLFDHHVKPGQPDITAPWLPRSPAMLLGLGNLIQNAVQFAHTRVEIDTSWDECGLVVRIADDGPGFPPHILGAVGEPYLSGRDDFEDGAHLGLGIFIATTLLTRTGARMAFANLSDGGAEIVVTWPRLPGGSA